MPNPPTRTYSEIDRNDIETFPTSSCAQEPLRFIPKLSRHEHLDLENRSMSATNTANMLNVFSLYNLQPVQSMPPQGWLCRIRARSPVTLFLTSSRTACDPHLISTLSTIVRPLPSQHVSATNSHIHAHAEAAAYTGSSARPPACPTPDNPPATHISGSSCRCLRLGRKMTALSRDHRHEDAGLGLEETSAGRPPAFTFPPQPDSPW